MNKKTFTCGYCFAFYLAGEGCGCKDAQFDRAKERIAALEGVVEHWKDAFEKQIYVSHAKDKNKTPFCRECGEPRGLGHYGNCSYRKYYITAKKLEEVE